MRIRLRATLLLTLLAAAGCAWFGGGDDDDVRRAAAARSAPPALPEALAAALRRDFPRLRGPLRSDQVGSGDFDGDGRADFAVLLAGDRGGALAVYLRDERRGFRLAWPQELAGTGSDDAGLPAAGSVRVVRAGSPYSFARETAGRGYEGRITHAYHFDRDAVVHVASERRETILYWGEGRFESLDFGE